MATFYVSATNGNDSNDGLTPATAKATFGTTGVGSLMTEGGNDEIYCQGDFNDIALLPWHEIPNGASNASRHIFRNYTGETVTFSGNTGGGQDGFFIYLTNRSNISIIGDKADRTGFVFYGDQCSQGIVFIGNGGGIDGICNNITLQGCTFTIQSSTSLTGGLLISNSATGETDAGGDNILLSNCEFSNLNNPVPNPPHAIYPKWKNSQIDGCLIRDINAGHGIHSNSEGAGAILNNLVISNNKIYNITNSHGIRIGTGNDAWVYNNLIYNCGSDGIILGRSGHDIDHNTIYNISTATANWCGIEFENCDDTHIRNNIIHTADFGVFLDGVSQNNILQNNILFNCGTNYLDSSGGATGNTQNGTIGADPMFVNIGVDFHLNSGSPAINAGIIATGVSTDHDGLTRDTPPDIGAYELVATNVGASLNTSGSGQTVTVSAPSAAGSGDLMIVAIHSNGDINHAQGVGDEPAFDKDFQYAEGGGGATMSIWSRRLDGTETGTYEFTISESQRWTIIAVTFENPHPTDIYDVFPTASNASAVTSGTAPSITTLTSFAIHCAVMGVDGDTIPITNTPIGYEVEQEGGTQRMAFCTKVINTAGATGTTAFAWTGSGTQDYQSISFAIKNASQDVTILFGTGAGG